MIISAEAERYLERSNDAIQKHRSAAVWNLTLGVALVALAISVTDLALLAGSAQEIAELGVALPVRLIMGFGPVVYVLSYAYVNRQEFQVRQLIALAGAELNLGSEQISKVLQATVNANPLIMLAPPPRGLGGAVSMVLSGGFRIVFPLVVLVALEVSAIRAQQADINGPC